MKLCLNKDYYTSHWKIYILKHNICLVEIKEFGLKRAAICSYVGWNDPMKQTSKSWEGSVSFNSV